MFDLRTKIDKANDTIFWNSQSKILLIVKWLQTKRNSVVETQIDWEEKYMPKHINKRSFKGPSQIDSDFALWPRYEPAYRQERAWSWLSFCIELLHFEEVVFVESESMGTEMWKGRRQSTAVPNAKTYDWVSFYETAKTLLATGIHGFVSLWDSFGAKLRRSDNQQECRLPTGTSGLFESHDQEERIYFQN